MPRNQSETSAEKRTVELTTSLDSLHSSMDQTVELGEELPQIPGYDLLAELGRGAMGIVYRATQLSVGREVAIKTLLDNRGPEYRERFRAEAESVAKLQHANIAQLYD